MIVTAIKTEQAPENKHQRDAHVTLKMKTFVTRRLTNVSKQNQAEAIWSDFYLTFLMVMRGFGRMTCRRWLPEMRIERVIQRMKHTSFNENLYYTTFSTLSFHDTC